MVIDDLACVTTENGLRLAATVTWEDRDFPSQQLVFDFSVPPSAVFSQASESVDRPLSGEDACPDAFLTACFPLAAVHGERRVRIDGDPCPMLIEGLRTAYSLWSVWGGMPMRAPEIEVRPGIRRAAAGGPRRAIGFLSGGVDGLHMLMRNRQLYLPDDPAYIRDVLFVHGFDIGKRRRDPENACYRAALSRLEPVVAEAGVRLISCRTNLRHLPSRPGFWEDRHMGSGLAAVGHAATIGPAFVFIGGSYSLHTPIPWGSHFAVDGLFSSQRVSIVHEGLRFTRLEKVGDLANWRTALDSLRCCPAPTASGGNCRHCEKCIRTRLELLAVGVNETEALGPSLTPLELWEDIAPASVGERITFYEDVLPLLRRRGYNALCKVIEGKIAAHQGLEQRRLALA